MVTDFPKRVVHGGAGKRMQEKTYRNTLDFSASVNPFPPDITWDFNPRDLERYPDDNYSELKEAIAQSYNRDPAEICVGNGSIELIRVFCSVLFRSSRQRNFFLTDPTFGEYELSALLAGASRCDAAGSGVHFVCNPNNPTGTIRTKESMMEILAADAAEGTMLFCDEAFIDLSDPRQSLSDISHSRLFVLQSLTKSFAVPGLRFGYGFGDPDLVEKIEITRPPWSINAYAEAFAYEAVRHRGKLEESRRLIAREREWLANELSRFGLSPLPSMANFILIRCAVNVAPLCRNLEDSGILVRDCTSFGLPDHLRIAVRTREENRMLVEAIGTCLH